MKIRGSSPISMGSDFRSRRVQDPENSGNPVYVAQAQNQVVGFFKKNPPASGHRVFNLCDSSVDWNDVIPAPNRAAHTFGLLVFPKAEQPRVIENCEAFIGLKPSDPKPKVITSADDISDETWVSMVMVGDTAWAQLARQECGFDFLFVTAFSHQNDKNGLIVVPSDKQLAQRGLQNAKDVKEFLKTLPATIQGTNLSAISDFLDKQKEVMPQVKIDSEKKLRVDLANIFESAKNIHGLLLEKASKDPLYDNLKGKKQTRDFDIAMIQAQGHLQGKHPLATLAVELLNLQDMAFELAQQMDKYKAMVRIAAEVERELHTQIESFRSAGQKVPTELQEKQKTLLKIQNQLTHSDFEVEIILEGLMTLQIELKALGGRENTKR